MFIDHLQNTRTKWWDLFDTESNYIDRMPPISSVRPWSGDWKSSMLCWRKLFASLELTSMLEGHSLSVTWETPDGCLHTRISGAEMTKNVENWNTKKGELKTEKVVFFGKNCEISFFSNRRHNLTNLSIKKSAFFLWLSLLLSELITVTISFLILFYLSWHLCFKSRLYYTLIL